MAGSAAFNISRELQPAQTIGDDVYMVGDAVTVRGKVIGDLVAIAKAISCSGPIAADLLAIGGEVEIAGNINDDARVIGLLNQFTGNVGDDAVLIGFKVNTSPSSHIGHTAIILAGQSSIDGTIRGDLILSGYNSVISGDINGNVTASAAKLQLTPTAHIKGDLVYTGQDEIVIPPGAVVEGQIIHHKPAVPTEVFEEQGRPGGTSLLIRLAWDSSLMFIGVLLLFLLPHSLSTSSQTMAAKPWLACIYGFLWLVGAPVVASLALITIVGIPIAITVVFIYVAGLYLSALPVALWIGEKLFYTRGRPYLSILLGLLTISLARSLPYVGFVFSLITLTVGLGALVLGLRKLTISTKE